MVGNVNIGKDLTIAGRLNVKNFTAQNIITTTTNNYQLIVSEDLSLNGRMFVSGNVGIGVTAPIYTLDVSSASSQPFLVGVGATNALVVNNTGLVGIGSSTPATALDVVGNVRCSAGFDLNYSSLPTYSSTQIEYLINNSFSGISTTAIASTTNIPGSNFTIPAEVWIVTANLGFIVNTASSRSARINGLSTSIGRQTLSHYMIVI